MTYMTVVWKIAGLVRRKTAKIYGNLSPEIVCYHSKWFLCWGGRATRTGAAVVMSTQVPVSVVTKAVSF